MIRPTQPGPVRLSIVHGDPIPVKGRTLTPVARVIAGGGHVGTVREQDVQGRGWAFRVIRPVKVIEKRDGEAQTLIIPDVTRTTLHKMALVGAVVAAVSIAAILIARVKRAALV